MTGVQTCALPIYPNVSAAPAGHPDFQCTFTLNRGADGKGLEYAPVLTQVNPTPNTDHTYWFGDAVLIKQFGGGNPQYIAFHNKARPTPFWTPNSTDHTGFANSKNKNLVYEVCSCTAAGTNGADCVKVN